jgi:hypothetical protein
VGIKYRDVKILGNGDEGFPDAIFNYSSITDLLSIRQGDMVVYLDPDQIGEIYEMLQKV